MKKPGGLGSWRTCGDYQNTEKRSGDLRRLTVTQTPVKNHQLTLIWKNSKVVNDMHSSSDKIGKMPKEKGNLKRETKYLLIAVQNDAIRTNYIKAKIDYT